MIETWRLVWRRGFVPGLSDRALEVLADALRANDPRLIQGGTSCPPNLLCVADWPVEAACPVGFCGWQTEGASTVKDVAEFFNKACFDADQRIGEPAACRWFLNAWDDTPREKMFRELLDEVELAIRERSEQRELVAC